MKLPICKEEIKTILDEYFAKERIATQFVEKLLALVPKDAKIEPLESIKIPLYYKKTE